MRAREKERVGPGNVLPSRLVLFVLVATVAIAPSRAQVSPGPLSEPHRKLEGSLECLRCHGGGARPMSVRCMECHAEIKWLVDRKRGLHGRAGREECGECHAEHLGLEHDLVQFPGGGPERFDHQETGWGLAGAHRRLKCEDCHKSALQVSDSIRLTTRIDKPSSYIGLEPECSSCHADPHRGRFGGTCDSCHDTSTWKSIRQFDHAKTGYPLTGKHSTLACEKCHRDRAQAEGAARERIFPPLPHEECSSCHEDIHRSRLGPRCSRCHDTGSFRSIDRKSFDHDLTAYPLEGRHAKVACEKCHGTSEREQRRPPHERCTDCHADAHGTQLADLTGYQDCASCHRVEGWKPSTFGVEAHAKLSFPLKGKHATSPCADCHRPSRPNIEALVSAADLGRARVAFDLGRPRCQDCHRDPHDGRFSLEGKRPIDGGCEACHDIDHFRPSSLSNETHQRVGFPIRGAHKALACEKCHPGLRPSDDAGSRPRDAHSGAKPLILTVQDACGSCHKSPHGEQFAARRDGGACEACHGQGRFRPATEFDHDRGSRFPLLRAHGKVVCTRCHEQRLDVTGQSLVVYRPISLDCKECHRRIAPTAPGGGAVQPVTKRR